MPVVKTEQVNVGLPEQTPPYRSRNGPAPLSEDNGRRLHRYMRGGGTRVRGRRPCSGSGRPHDTEMDQEVSWHQAYLDAMEQQRREEAHAIDESASALTRAIGKASHEDLLNSGNVAYRDALQDLAQAHRETAQYHQQNMELFATLISTRDARDQLAEQYKISLRQINQVKQAPDSTQRRATTQATSVPEQHAKITGTSVHLMQEGDGPIVQPGGLVLRTQTWSWYAIAEPRPSDLPFEVFWEKSDWPRKGCNWTFVCDRKGIHLAHLMKGIRDIARRIWAELDNSGSPIAKSFHKNSPDFKATYAATIEEVYPCLKLCSGHWKALQIGVRTYSHWYAGRIRKREQMSDSIKPNIM